MAPNALFRRLSSFQSECDCLAVLHLHHYRIWTLVPGTCTGKVAVNRRLNQESHIQTRDMSAKTIFYDYYTVTVIIPATISTYSSSWILSVLNSSNWLSMVVWSRNMLVTAFLNDEAVAAFSSCGCCCWVF